VISAGHAEAGIPDLGDLAIMEPLAESLQLPPNTLTK
jgi:hypothetical protein